MGLETLGSIMGYVLGGGAILGFDYLNARIIEKESQKCNDRYDVEKLLANTWTTGPLSMKAQTKLSKKYL